MIGELKLRDYDDFYDSFFKDFEIIDSDYSFCFSLRIDDEKTISSYFENIKIIEEELNLHIIINEDDSLFFDKKADDERNKTLKFLKEHINNLYDYIEYIYLDFTNIDSLEFIKNNDILKGKKIVLNEFIQMNDENKVIELKKKYKDFNNIYVNLEGNKGYVTLDECLSTIAKVKEQTNYISKLNLSPIETIMFTYDIVRSRIYNAENENDSSFDSRNLSSVLFGDKIVCTGYSNLFSVLLRDLGIETYNVGLYEKNNDGHEMNYIYVKDSKYNIDGVYYFDTTWDSKLSENDNSYLYSYRYFAKTKFEMEDLEDNVYSFGMHDVLSRNFINDFKNIVSDNRFNFSSFKYLTQVNKMSNLILNKEFIDTSNLFKVRSEDISYDKIEELFDKYNNPISGETYLKILNNVRKIENYIDPKLYNYSHTDLLKIFINSKWNFKNNYLSREQRLLELIFNEKKENNIYDDYKNFVNKENITRDVLEIRLLKQLKKIRDIKKNNND